MTALDFHRWRRNWGAVCLQAAIAGIALAGAIGMQRSQLERPSLWVSAPKLAEQQEAARLKLLRQLPTFGFDNILADWTFLNFLEYYGDEPLRQQTGYNLAPDYFDIITRLDPHFIDAYQFLSSSVSYQLGRPDLTVRLMNRSTDVLSPQVNPDAYRVWRYKGIDQLLLLGDVSGSIKSHEQAAAWAKPVDAQLSSLYQATAEFLRRDPNSVPVRVSSWSSIFVEAAAAGDQQTQARAKAELLKLGYRMQIDGNGQPQLQQIKAAPNKLK